MIEKKEHFHGSDLEKIEQYYGVKKEDIISFSANVNPLGISFRLREELSAHLNVITTYPDREYTALRQAIGQYVQTDYQNIIVGNGSTELISLVIKLISPKKALIIGPTYSEYQHEISLGGGHSCFFQLREETAFQLEEEGLWEALSPDTDLLVLCNPNNPTSSQISRKTMRNILDCCQEKGIFVMVDETYVEFSESTDEITSIPLTEHYDNIIILRGVSKFFAAPGLRLGYAVCGNRELLGKMAHFQNPWSLNSLAAIAGEIMFQDTEYRNQTIRLISTERQRICGLLKDWPSVKYYDPHANFVLLRILREDITSEDMFEFTIRKGLMIRDCSSFPFLSNQYIRFCLMNPEDNNLLLKTMREILSSPA